MEPGVDARRRSDQSGRDGALPAPQELFVDIVEVERRPPAEPGRFALLFVDLDPADLGLDPVGQDLDPVAHS